jgi:hypothetical protein
MACLAFGVLKSAMSATPMTHHRQVLTVPMEFLVGTCSASHHVAEASAR